MANLDAPPFPSSRSTAGSRRRTKRRWGRIVFWIVAGLAVVLVVAATLGVLRLRAAAKAALPTLDGDLGLAGLSAPVTVRRDGHGVPHIEAANEQDLFLAQGYVTAQDRLWQMDAYRRNAKGELAELLGPSLVAHDRAQRVLGFGKVARRIYAHLPTDDRARLDAYARGVNLYIEQHQDALPPEFALLFYKPKPWTGEDSIAVGLMMVQTLDTHWDTKLARERVAARLHDEKLEADLYPVGSWRDHPPTGIQVDLSQPRPVAPANKNEDDEEDDSSQARVMPAPEDTRALRAVQGLADCDGCAAGSNNWVIAGKHTASGKPLLSNDMHLGISVPNIWYMADLRAAGVNGAEGFHAAGVTLPGFPYVIAGHNEHVAWGFTALYADVQDLYIERLDGRGNYESSVDGNWKPLEIDHEVIHVRGGKDVFVDVQSTNDGPLLNPLFTKETRPIALKWTLYDASLNTLPVYQLNTAANWTEFSAALSQWSWPTQNVVYSDDQGNIGYHAIGKVPKRPTSGSAWDRPLDRGGLNWGNGRSEWRGYIPFEQLPNAFDPQSGFLATANSNVSSEKFPHEITREWAEPYRAERIYKLLQGRDGLKAADMLAVQTDIYSEVDQEIAHRLAYAIDQTDGLTGEDAARLKQAADLMRSWDGRLTTDSAAASLVTQARRAFWPLILKPKLGEDADAYRWSESNFAEEEIIMHGGSDGESRSPWLPTTYKSWDALLTDAVRKGMEEGKAPADVSKWTYGSWHVIDIEHPLATFLPLVSRIAGTGEQPLSGDTVTVKQVGRDFGPSQRFTMDWSDVDGSTENISLGESGNPYSPYFRDQWTDYYNGTTFPLPFTSAAVAAQTRHTLRLVP